MRWIGRFGCTASISKDGVWHTTDGSNVELHHYLSICVAFKDGMWLLHIFLFKLLVRMTYLMPTQVNETKEK